MPTPSLATLALRLDAAEARIRELEGGYAETLYRLHRTAVHTRLGLGRVIDHLGLTPVSDAEVDDALDEE